jgi:hypothetical protein
MKKIPIMLAVVLLLLSSAGCITGLTPGGTPDAKAAKITVAPQRPPTVYAESITSENAHQKALALDAEMDFDVQSAQAPAPPKVATR